MLMGRVIVPKILPTLFVSTWRDMCEDEAPTLQRINYGWCYQFALVLYRLHGGRARLWSNCEHVWIQVGTKHYDSDFPNGTTDLDELLGGIPCNCGQDRSDCLQGGLSEKAVVNLWEDGGSGPVRYSVIERTVLTYNRARNRKSKALV